MRFLMLYKALIKYEIIKKNENIISMKIDFRERKPYLRILIWLIDNIIILRKYCYLILSIC